MYLIHKFHNLSWINEINEFSHNILIYWDAPVYSGPKNYLEAIKKGYMFVSNQYNLKWIFW